MNQDLYDKALKLYERFTRTPPNNEIEQRLVEARKRELDDSMAELQRWLKVVS